MKIQYGMPAASLLALGLALAGAASQQADAQSEKWPHEYLLGV